MSKEDWKENNLKAIFKKEWPKGIVSILDVGCGLSLKSKYLPAKIRVGVDIYPEYFKHIESDVPYVVVKYDARKLREIFEPKSFDLVIATDIVEHLHFDEAMSMIRQCEEIARKAVILETPMGMVHQNLDITGHGGHEWQTHRSAWSIRDFKIMGYKTKIRDYKMQDVKRHTSLEVGPDITLIDAIKCLES